MSMDDATPRNSRWKLECGERARRVKPNPRAIFRCVVDMIRLWWLRWCSQQIYVVLTPVSTARTGTRGRPGGARKKREMGPRRRIGALRISGDPRAQDAQRRQAAGLRLRDQQGMTTFRGQGRPPTCGDDGICLGRCEEPRGGPLSRQGVPRRDWR